MGSAPPRTHDELPLSSNALLDSASGLKWLSGQQSPSGWQGVRYPNASSKANDPNVPLACGATGCLFNVSSDPHEHHDLAAALPEVAAAMRARLTALAESFFENNDTGVDACPPGLVPKDVPCACWLARHHYGGNLGPFQEIQVDASALLGTCLPCCEEPAPGQPCCCKAPDCPLPPSCPPRNGSGAEVVQTNDVTT